MKWLKILKILWTLAGYLEEFWPEDSEWTDEKDLLKKIAEHLIAKVG